MGYAQSLENLNCTGGGATAVVTSAPERISVSPAAPAGTILTPWYTSAANENVFSCVPKGTASFQMINRLRYTGSGEDTGLRIENLYPVYKTNIFGIGLAVGAQGYLQGSMAWGWQPSMLGASPPQLTENSAQTSFEPMPLGGQAKYAFVKTVNGPIAGGVVASAISAITHEIYVGGSSPTKPPGPWQPQTYSLPAIAIVPITCQTPDITVDMGTVLPREFHGPGTIARRQSFQIKLENCPHGFNSIQYLLDPVNSIIDYKNSVIALDADGAKGVGLQLLDAQGSPLPLQQAVAVPGYTPEASNISIPLQAAYYQTASVITAGIANAAVRFTLTYE